MITVTPREASASEKQSQHQPPTIEATSKFSSLSAFPNCVRDGSLAGAAELS